jgi:hypothetical protein
VNRSRSTIKGFYAACAEDTSRTEAFSLDAGEPAILCGTDTGPNPVEYLLPAPARGSARIRRARVRGARPDARLQDIFRRLGHLVGGADGRQSTVARAVQAPITYAGSAPGAIL